MFAGRLSTQEEQLLQRSAEHRPGQHPITATDCPRWDNPDVAMWLTGDLYAAEYGRYDPPGGNVQLIWPGHADRYLHNLAEVGLIVLAENPAVTADPKIEIRGTRP